MLLLNWPPLRRTPVSVDALTGIRRTLLESGEAKADRLIAEELARLRWTQEDLAAPRKGDSSKMAMAARLRRETTLTVRRIAEKLQAGRPEGARANLHRCLKQSTAKSPQRVG